MLAAALAVGSAAGAQAATVNLTSFDRAASRRRPAGAQGLPGRPEVSNLHVETFEGKPAWNGTSGTTQSAEHQGRQLHQHQRLGHGAGHSVINGGTGLEVRGDNDMAWGRYNADELAPGIGGNWLDSNDTHGMRWDIAGLGKFNALAFFLIDAADVGAQVLDQGRRHALLDDPRRRRPHPRRQHPAGDHPARQAVDSLTVELFNDRLNDGFGVDGAIGGAYRAGAGAAGGGAPRLRPPRLRRLPAPARRRGAEGPAPPGAARRPCFRRARPQGARGSIPRPVSRPGWRLDPAIPADPQCICRCMRRACVVHVL